MKQEFTKQTSKPRASLRLFLFALLCILGMANAPDILAQTYGGGSGTSTNPYLIKTKAHLTELQTQANSGKLHSNTSPKYFKMTNDIDMGGDALRIGNSSYSVNTITFDGGGFTISNVTCNYMFSNYSNLGLFGWIQNTTIQNLTIKKFLFYGYDRVGSLVGYVTGSSSIIENCHAEDGNLANTNYASGGTSFTYAYGAGGLVGYHSAGSLSINYCSVANNVTVMSLCSHSIAFQNEAGRYIGGLVGGTNGSSLTISDCLIANKKSTDTQTYYVGGVIGYCGPATSTTLIRVVVPVNNIPSGLTTSYKGSVVGYAPGKVTCYNSFFNNTSYAPSSQTSNVTGARDYTSAFPQTVNYPERVYNYLERTNNSGGTIAGTSRGNEKWTYGTDEKFGVTRGPLLSKSDYVILVKRDLNSISSFSSYNSFAYYFSSSGELYTPAQKSFTVSSSLTPTKHQKLRYKYRTYAGTETTLTTLSNSVKENYTFTSGRTVDGTVSSVLINIPYPEIQKATFDQWTNKMTLTWTATNADNITGKWYIYKRAKGSLEGWTRFTDVDIKIGSAEQTYTRSLDVTASEWDKSWEYAVSFIPTGESVTGVPHAYNSDTIEKETKIIMAIGAPKAESQKSSIKLTFAVPEQLDNSTNYSYSIFRKAGEATSETSYTEIVSGQRFNKTTEISYTDNEPSSSCDRYTYKLQITAFGRTFESAPVTSNISGNSVLLSLKATKGEYNNQVRVEWESSKISSGTVDRYKVFRCVATNPDGTSVNQEDEDVWTELATVNTEEANYIYSDDKAMPGVYYRYKVVLYQVCGLDDISELDSKKDIGFSQSLGTVSGRVTYGSGISVENVSVSVVRNDLQTNESQYHSLLSNGEGKTFKWKPTEKQYKNMVAGDLTYQFWLKPTADMSDRRKVGEIGRFCEIYLVKQGDNRYKVEVIHPNSSGTSTTLLSDHSILPERFAHIAIVRSGSNLFCYIVNDEDLADIQVMKTSASVTLADFDSHPIADLGISMGYLYKGNIDECRFWTKALTETEIKRDYNRILTGAEEKLKAYWTFDEGLDESKNDEGAVVEDGYFFDISRVGTTYNRNHGNHNLSSSSEVPSRDQLALKAITDANGNYQIRGIPFSGEGTSYDIVPTLGIHKFNPTSQLRYISNSSLVHNATDFSDISNFEVKGTVVYGNPEDGGTYPVEGCSFEVDGKTVVYSNGTPVTSDINGRYSISVPIGEHTVRIVKTGHNFFKEGYLDMPEGGYNQNITGNFFDLTRVKLIGRVVGGLTENDKPLGFGESLNNTGAKTITLKSTRNYKFRETPKTETFYHNEGQWKKPGSRENDQTSVTYNQKDIVINISPETGEFVALVYPEAYNIGEITAKNYLEAIYDKGETIDLSSAPVPSDDMRKTSVRTWTDSIEIVRPGQDSYFEKVEKSDTVRYHAEWKTYYQAVPTFSATQVVSNQPVSYFGDLEYTIEDKIAGESETIQLWDETNGYLFGNPVFKQGKKYTFAFKAYEEYKNHETGADPVRYMVDQGVVNFNNSISLTEPEPIRLDANGEARYTFTAGAPNLTTAKNNFEGKLSIGAASYYWDLGREPIEAWHLGDKTSGTDFMTSGPNQITAILRDPPGSLSYSYIEKGTTITTTTTSEVKDGLSETLNLTTSLGPKITTFVGLGAGVIMESEVKLDASVGLNSEQTWSSSEETTQTTTFTERFETSSDPLYVGHLGDVFIGNSTNIQYGLTNGISIQKNFLGESNEEFLKEGAYSIVKSAAVAYGQTFDTRFAFTQVELEEIMIPKWQDNLKFLLKPVGTVVNTASITSPVYVSKLPVDNENFGKLNTDKDAFGSKAVSADKFHNGPSYTIYFPNGYDMKNFKTDSVMYFNNQINGWVQVLAQNEEEKVKMNKLGNYSFGAGASIEWSKTESTSQTMTSTFHWMLNPTIGALVGGDVMGIGLELETTLEYVHEEDETESETKETSITSGFVLQEEGDDDEITVDYGMTSSGTIAFKTRGGRTSCPYEGTAKTKYYQPDQHILSEGTMQIEVPKIEIIGSAHAINVPANKTATFKLALQNESETGEDVWFQLIVDEVTNPNGAELKIDGGIIGNGRMFMVKAGETLQKTLTVGKGTVDKYEKIGLILRSECQSDPTTFLPVIADTVFITAEFIPACNEVNIKAPANNWIVNTNTGDNLRVTLDGFETDFDNFGYLKLEARKAGNPAWSTITNFYANKKIYDKATGNKEMIAEGASSLSYDWNMKTLDDGNYELRATAVCVNADSEGKILSQISEYVSDVMNGIKDMTRPEALGKASPVNGILTAGDDISITFNEEIQTAMLTRNNFKIKGLLNASEIGDPSTGLYFNGSGSAYTELPIACNGSFSIETWLKRVNNTAGTLFSYGTNNEFISLGFDNTGHAVVKIGEETQTSVNAISNTSSTWKFVGINYNRDERTVSVYAFEDGVPDAVRLFVSKPFTNEPPVQGKLYVGSANDGSNGFQGSVAGVHMYNVAHTDAEMTIVKGTSKSGTEPNLIGLWEMEEAEGTIAKDKARNRNMILNTGWYIYPAGKSLAFNGTNQYAQLPSSEFPFRYWDDFTIEMQFKGESQGVATLLSIGTSVYIGFDADHKLVLTTGENTQVLTATNLLDGQWHHIALSVKRSGTATTIIDGAAASTFSSNIFTGDVGGGFYSLGVRYFENKVSGNYERTQYFKGNIDEVRVWNSVLGTDFIARNKKYKLTGNETGLLSYYPFETWVRNVDGTYHVSTSDKDLANDTRTMTGSATMDNVAATVIDAPYVTEINNFSYVSSSNKIVINLEEELYRIEGVTLEISVEEVEDMRGNISKPVKWIAYVNQNPVNWITDPIDIVMEQGESRSFKASIQNTAGTTADFYIEDLPSWLSVNASSGTLQPLATKELTFSIYEGINAGSYETSIVLNGANKVQKNLPVSLKVTGERPDWSVNLKDFEQTMTITGQVQIESIPQEDEDDILAAFIGDRCVGIASPKFESSYNAYFIYMMAGGNSEDNAKAVTFKFWDANTGSVYPVIDLTEGGNSLNITFTGDNSYGTPDVPVYFNARDVVEQTVALSNGWNWISVFVNNDNPALIDQFKSNALNYATQMKAGDGNFLNNTGNSWSGLITSLAVDQMYVVKATQDAALKMVGKPAKPATTPITLGANKWSWIGYTPQFSLPVSEALAGIGNPVLNDQIKGQRGYRILSSKGWIGSLNNMEPGLGYKYKSGNTQQVQFNYPNASVSLRSASVEEDMSIPTRWDVKYSQFSNNMTVTAALIAKQLEISDGIFEIAAFSGSECRGSAIVQYVDGFEQPYMGFLMVYGETDEKIEFRVYDHATGKEYRVYEILPFSPDATYGTPDELFEMNLRGTTGIDDLDGMQIVIYPNPVEKDLYISHDLGTLERVEIFDVSGKLMLLEENFSDSSIDVSSLSKGTYFIHVIFEGERFVNKFMKK